MLLAVYARWKHLHPRIRHVRYTKDGPKRLKCDRHYPIFFRNKKGGAPPLMDTDFREPRLELYYMINEANTPEECERLRQYLVERCNIGVYRRMAERKLFPLDSGDLEQMEARAHREIKELEEQAEQDAENETRVFELKKQICEAYARAMNMEKFKPAVRSLTELEPSLSLKMDIFLCRIRIAVITNDRKGLSEQVHQAKEIFETSCDWDRKNRFKIYQGLYSLIKTDFHSAARFFTEGLASFDAGELFGLDRLVLYLVFSSLLTFSRGELCSKILENSEVRQFPAYLDLADAYYNCNYAVLLKSMLGFIDTISADPVIGIYREHFCKEMKLRSYSQLLISYQSMHLDRMAEAFEIQAEHLEHDLCNFINEGRLQCIIDKVNGIVNVAESQQTDNLELVIRRGSSILRNIKKTIKRV
ncbi:26S proteasome regulatory subunit N7 [Pancytospora philotis]|nr:26S proteasome regulatory subunit N7 [Pancytospora philotis]